MNSEKKTTSYESQSVKYSIKLDSELGSDPTYIWLTDKIEVMVFIHEGKIKAFSSICPHMGAQLCYKKRAKILQCPWHGLTFNLESKESNHYRYKEVLEYKAEVIDGELLIYR